MTRIDHRRHYIATHHIDRVQTTEQADCGDNVSSPFDNVSPLQMKHFAREALLRITTINYQI